MSSSQLTFIFFRGVETTNQFTYMGIELHLGFELELAKMWMHPCINGPVGEQPGLRCVCAYIYIYIYRLYMVIWQVHDVVGLFQNTADSGRVSTWSPGRLWTQDRKKVVGTLGLTSPPTERLGWVNSAYFTQESDHWFETFCNVGSAFGRT